MQVTHCQEAYKTICEVTNIMLRKKHGKLLAKFFIRWHCLALYTISTQSGREWLGWMGVKRFWLKVRWNLQSRNSFLIYVQGRYSITYSINFWTPNLQKKNTYFMSHDVDERRCFRLISKGAQAIRASRKGLLNE